MFFGDDEESPQYDYLIASDLISIAGKGYSPSCDEIMKVRQ